MALLKFTSNGIYCEQGDFYIDPWRPVERAVITHAHSDHARWGMKSYLAHPITAAMMRHRIGQNISVDEVSYNDTTFINGVKISLHPAGHIPGSSQIRVEFGGEVWVAAGDYKLDVDGISEPFDPVKCHAFITESTFGLPIYEWKQPAILNQEINNWWDINASAKKTSIIYCYSLGKAQRILNALGDQGKVFVHGAVHQSNEVLAICGLALRESIYLDKNVAPKELEGAMILAPPSTQGSAWTAKFKNLTEANASGWMTLRGARRRMNVEKGLVISDHADWNSLITAVKSTGAEKVIVTHGYTDVFAKYLSENGWNAITEKTEFGEEEV
jgi:putative mRNA 3-end processing factor